MHTARAAERAERSEASEAADICDAQSQRHDAKQQPVGTDRCEQLARWLGAKKIVAQVKTAVDSRIYRAHKSTNVRGNLHLSVGGKNARSQLRC